MHDCSHSSSTSCHCIRMWLGTIWYKLSFLYQIDSMRGRKTKSHFPNINPKKGRSGKTHFPDSSRFSGHQLGSHSKPIFVVEHCLISVGCTEVFGGPKKRMARDDIKKGGTEGGRGGGGAGRGSVREQKMGLFQARTRKVGRRGKWGCLEEQTRHGQHK